MYLKNKYQNQKGIGLVEVIAALGISIIVITSLVSLAVYTLRSSLQSKLQLQGTKIANRELELVRALRDSSATWEEFKSSVDSCTQGSPCSMNDLTVVGSATTQGTAPEDINRSFYILYPNAGDENTIRINVSVQWTVGPQTKYAHVYTDLTNWRGR